MSGWRRSIRTSWYWNSVGDTSLNYRGFISNLFWTPNHALPGWFFAVLLLLHLRREIDIAVLGLAFVILLFWSPLAMIGALPFIAICVLRALPGNVFCARNMIAIVAALCFLPVLFYLTLDAGTVGREWLLGLDGFWLSYLLLLIFGMPQAWIVLASWSKLAEWRKTAVGAAVFSLLLIPIYRIGAAPDDNDLAMRAPTIALFVVAIVFCEIASATLTGRRKDALGFAAVAIVALSGLWQSGGDQRQSARRRL